MRLLRWLPLTILAACGPASVSGEVDGDRIGGARDAIYDTVEFGPFELMVVVITDFPDACTVYEEFWETIEPNCDDRCDDYRDIAEDYLGGKDYWSLALAIVPGGSFEDEYDYEPDIPGEDEFNLAFRKYDVEPLYDADDCEDARQDGELLLPDLENGNDGDLEILLYDDDDEIVKGRFEVDMGGEEALRGSFTATECNMVEWLPWL